MKIWITKIILFFIIATKLFGQDMIIFQPSMNIGLENWRIINDDVMGGISKSYISLNDENNMLFNGYLSLENRGGFASCRNSLSEKISSIGFLLADKKEGNFGLEIMHVIATKEVAF